MTVRNGFAAENPVVLQDGFGAASTVGVPVAADGAEASARFLPA